MRTLMWFAIGFGIACAACAYWPNSGYPLAGVVCLIVAVGIAALCRKQPVCRRAAVALLGCMAGIGWFWLFDGGYLACPREADGQIIQTSISVSGYSRASDYGVSADGWLELEGKPYRVRFYINSQEALTPGDQVEGQFRLRLTAPGGLQAATYHSGMGIFLLAYPAGQMVISYGERVPLKYYPTVLRQKVLTLLKQVFPSDAAAFAQALLLGDSSQIDYQTNTALTVSGIRHVIAVSGLHVSILCAMLLLLTGKQRIRSAVICGPVLILFAAMAGFTPSITRACTMMLLMLLASLCYREYDPPTALAFAALVMLAGNPMTITSVSFQLSVGSIAGIFLFSGRLYQWLQKRMGQRKGIKAKLARWIIGSVSVTLGAMSLTTPLIAYYFGSVSLVGVFTNLLTLWMIAFIFYGILAACLLGAVWLPLGKAAGWLVSWLIRYVLTVSKLLARIPVAAVYTRSGYIVLWLAAVYVLFAIFLLGKRKRPALFICCGALGLCLALACGWIQPVLEDFRVTVLDVGQGQCILLQSQGKTYMVDCGGGDNETAADIAAETLLSQGISHIDGLILTHYDQDHVGGAPYFLSRVSADTIYLPGEDVIGISEGEAVLVVEQNLVVEYGTTKITLFPGERDATDNENSMCILFQTEKYDILITGDRTVEGERALLEQMEMPKLELLIVGHHGSKTSTGEELLAATRPETAVISVGAGNSYGHPTQEVLDRLAEYGCVVYRTDLDGTILYRG